MSRKNLQVKVAGIFLSCWLAGGFSLTANAEQELPTLQHEELFTNNPENTEMLPPETATDASEVFENPMVLDTSTAFIEDAGNGDSGLLTGPIMDHESLVIRNTEIN